VTTAPISSQYSGINLAASSASGAQETGTPNTGRAVPAQPYTPIISPPNTGIDNTCLTIESLPAGDLFSIMEWRADSGLRSLFNHIYEWYTKSGYPGMPRDMSRNEFDAFIKSKGSRWMLKLVDDFIKSSNLYKPFELAINEKRKIITSLEFNAGVRWLANNIGLGQTDKPYYQMFTIFAERELDKQRYLNALMSPEFCDFYSMLENNYGIDPGNSLKSTLNGYLDPISQNYYRSEATQKAFALLRKYFPGTGMNNVRYIDVLKTIADHISHRSTLEALLSGGELEDMFRERADLYRKFVTAYGMEIDSPFALESFLGKNKDDILLLLKDRAVNTWQYFKNRYPAKLNGFRSLTLLISDHRLYLQQIASPFFFSGLNPESIDRFLACFGTDLGRIKGDDFSDLLSLDNTFIESLLNDSGKFNAFCDYVKLVFRKYPSLKDNIDLKLVDMITSSFSAKEKFIELNDMMAQFGNNVPDFGIRSADLKIETIKAARRMGFDRIYPDFCGEVELGRALELIVSADARRLYAALVNNWKLTRIELIRFLYVLSDPKSLAFFLDPANATKFNSLNSRYNIRNAGRPITSLNDIPNEVERDDIYASYDFLMDSRTFDLATNYLSSVTARTTGNGSILTAYVGSPNTANNLRTPDLPEPHISLRQIMGFPQRSQENIVYFSLYHTLRKKDYRKY